MKKLLLALLFLLPVSSVQAGPIAGAIAYWGIKIFGYTGIGACVSTVVVTAPLAAAATGPTVTGAALTVEATAASVGLTLTACPFLP